MTGARERAELRALDLELGPRAINAIARIWGREALQSALLAPDAYARLCESRGIGRQTIDEIDRALQAWGLPGVGGRDRVDAAHRKRLEHRSRAALALRAEGARELTLMLADVCSEQVLKSKQALTRRLSKARRAREQAHVSYYSACETVLRRCAADLPHKP